MSKRARIENRAKRKAFAEKRKHILQAMSYMAELTLIMADRLELMTVEQRQELAERHSVNPEYVDHPEKFRQEFFGQFTPDERLIEPDEATVDNWLLDVEDFRNLLNVSGLAPDVTFAPRVRITP